MKYKDWLCHWLDNYVFPTAKRRTYSRYKEIVYGHISAALGERELDDITALDLQRFTVQLLSCGNLTNGKGLSASSVNGIISVLQSSLKTAYTTGVAHRYIAGSIRRPRSDSVAPQCFTAAEQCKIERAVLGSRDPYFFGIVLCLYTGLRVGELLALEWSDVELGSGMLFVNKTCHYIKTDGGYERLIGSPKTKSSERAVPLPKQLLPMLGELKNNSRAKSVVARRGRSVSIRAYQYSFSRLLSRLGIEHKGFHALRHTFATRAVECGMDVKTLSELMGHKNSAVTLNRYVHSLPEHKRNMMDILGSAFAAQSPSPTN